jgi:hypothetical protein
MTGNSRKPYSLTKLDHSDNIALGRHKGLPSAMLEFIKFTILKTNATSKGERLFALTKG